MTVQQLKNKHKRARQEKRRKMVINTMGMVVLSVVVFFGINLALSTWEKEQEIQTQNNKNWQIEHSK